MASWSGADGEAIELNVRCLTLLDRMTIPFLACKGLEQDSRFSQLPRDVVQGRVVASSEVVPHSSVGLEISMVFI
jgi:hypothetical protein